MANAPIATAFVEIVPVLTRFAQKVKADVEDALQAADATMVARTGRMVQRAGDKITKLGDATAKFGMSWTRNVTAPIALTSAAIFKVGGDFEESLSRIVGLAGVSRRQVDAWGKEIMALAPALGQAPTELAKGLYFVASAGFKGAEAMDILKSSAKAASAGLGDTATVADAVTSAVNAYGPKVLSAAQATDIMVAAVREGKIEASELAPVLGFLLPTASAMKIRFSDVAGVLAVMSKTGLDASEAATSLNAIMSTLLHPSAAAAKALKAAGLSAGELRDIAAKPGGLVQVMRLLNDRFGDNEEALATIVPNVRAYRGVMNVLAQDSKGVDTVLHNVANSTGALDFAFAQAQRTAKFKFHASMAEVQNVLITLGATVLPMITQSLKNVTGMLVIFSKWWSGLSPVVQQIIVRLLLFAAAMGPVILIIGKLVSGIGRVVWAIGILIEVFPALGAAIGVAFDLAMGPVGWIIGALVLVGIGLVMLWKKSETFRDITKAVWAAVVAAAQTAWRWLLIGIRAIGAAFVWLWRNVVMPVWHGIQVAVGAGVTFAQTAFRWLMTAIHVLGGVWNWLYRSIIGPVLNLIKLEITIVVRLVQIYFGIWHIALILLGRAFMILYRNVIAPTMHAIGAVIKFVWDHLVYPTFKIWIATIYGPLAAVFRWLWHNLIEPAMRGIGAAISFAWNRIIKPVFNALGSFLRNSVAPAFRRGVQLIGAAWDGLKEAAKKPVRFVVDTVINKGIIGTFNKIASHFPGVGAIKQVPLPPGFAAGGVFDKPTAIVGEGNTARPEYVIPTDPRHRNRAMSLYEDLGAHLMQGGGILGTIGNFLLHPIRSVRDVFGGTLDQLNQYKGSSFGQLISAMPSKIASVAVDFIKGKLKTLGGLLGGLSLSGGMGWQRQWAAVHAAFPWAQLFSSFRPGARTISGFESYHAIGRAIDVSPSMQIFNWIRTLYGAKTKELIFTPAGGLQIKDGRPHVYSGPVAAQHYSHVHWAYDNGGILPPGLTMAYNGTGRNERVVPDDGLEDALYRALMRAGVGHVEVIVSVDGEELKRVIRVESRKQIGSAANELQVGRR